jgi:dTDP-L-rhamnose 4-epimerase
VKVLLTGSAGFIGSAITAQLDAAGADVVGVDLMLPQAHGTTVAPEGTHVLDVREVAQWSSLMADVDVVCHQAALVGAGVRVADLPDYASHNDFATAALLAAMHEHQVNRLVLASSMVVYGEGRYCCAEHGVQLPGARAVADLEAGRFENPCQVCGEPLTWQLVEENARLDPRSSYAASKLAQEHYASGWVRQAGATAIALRYHNVYGPGMPRDTPYSGVAAMFRSSLERGDRPRVFEDGGQMRDFVHVDDVARANVRAIEAVLDRSGFSAYNVCSGSPIAIRDVAALVARGTDAAPQPVITGEFRLGDVRHVVASPALAASELGFTALIAPAEGLPAFATAPLRPAVS